MANMNSHMNGMANFCAFNSLNYYTRTGDRPSKKEALEFVKNRISQSPGSCLFFGDRASPRTRGGMIYDIASQLPKNFSFSEGLTKYDCSVFLSPPYLNYNSRHIVKHCIIQWTKKRIKAGAKTAG